MNLTQLQPKVICLEGQNLGQWSILVDHGK